MTNNKLDPRRIHIFGGRRSQECTNRSFLLEASQTQDMTGWVKIKIAGGLRNYCKSLDVHSSYWSPVRRSTGGVTAVICSKSFQMSQLLCGRIATSKSRGCLIDIYIFIFFSRQAGFFTVGFSLLLSLSKGKWRAQWHNRWHLMPSSSPGSTQWPVPCCHSGLRHCVAEFISRIRLAISRPASKGFTGQTQQFLCHFLFKEPGLSPECETPTGERLSLSLAVRIPDNESLIQEMKLPWA